jgi:hypothetical protein
VTTDGENDPLASPYPPIRRLQGMRIAEPHRPYVLEQVNPATAKLVGHVLLVVRVASDPGAVGQHVRQVRHRGGSFQPETPPR